MLHFPAPMFPWSQAVTATHPIMVINLTAVTEAELFMLWMQGFAVGAEIDRRKLGHCG